MEDITKIKLKQFMYLFKYSYINSENELIVIPKFNLFFRLEDVETLTDLYAKIIAWLSKSACNFNYYQEEWRNKKIEKMLRDNINCFLGTKFNSLEMDYLYCIYGNMINKEKLYEFIENDFSLSTEEHTKGLKHLYDLLVKERGIKVYE